MNLLPNKPIIETERLNIRNWRERDIELFYEINSDDDVMEFFPFRRNRAECAELMEKFQSDITNNKYGWFALALKDSDEAIGFCGVIDVPPHMAKIPKIRTPAMEIGWRLSKRFWGKGYATEAARAVLHHAFSTLKQDVIVSYAVASNQRSTALMSRIGLNYIADADFDYPDDYGTSHPQLKSCVYYEITKDEWLAHSATAP